VVEMFYETVNIRLAISTLFTYKCVRQTDGQTDRITTVQVI